MDEQGSIINTGFDLLLHVRLNSTCA